MCSNPAMTYPFHHVGRAPYARSISTECWHEAIQFPASGPFCAKIHTDALISLYDRLNGCEAVSTGA